MLQEVPFAYSSRAQLDDVLNKFLQLMSDQDFKAYLMQTGNGDFETVNTLIQNRQKEILIDAGVDPDDGIRDLSRVKDFYPKNDPTMQKLVFVALREESLTNEVTIGYNNPSYRPTGVPNTMEELAANVSQFPSMMDDLRTHLQQNPHLISQMTTQQQQMLKQMIIAQQKVQQALAVRDKQLEEGRNAQNQQNNQPQNNQENNQNNQQQQKPEDDGDLPSLMPSKKIEPVQTPKNEYKSTIVPNKSMDM